MRESGLPESLPSSHPRPPTFTNPFHGRPNGSTATQIATGRSLDGKGDRLAPLGGYQSRDLIQLTKALSSEVRFVLEPQALTLSSEDSVSPWPETAPEADAPIAANRSSSDERRIEAWMTDLTEISRYG